MKRFLQSLKRQDGFTLVELMVVVAIIGLLSAVAIPNFKKYQAKAKMSEAKLQLSSLYTAQTAFFSDFNIYHNCIAYMGYNPQREIQNRYYAIGFGVAATTDTTAYGAATNSGLVAADCPVTNGVTAGPALFSDSVATQVTWFLAGKGVGSNIANTTAYLPATALGAQTSTTMTYTAGAGGIIDNDNVSTSQNSQLTINESKVFQVRRNGF